VVPSSAWTHHDRPPSELPRWSTRPLAGATVGVPEAAIMSTPWWVRPPERAAPKLSTNDAAPCTGHTNAAGAGAGGGTAAGGVGGAPGVGGGGGPRVGGGPGGTGGGGEGGGARRGGGGGARPPLSPPPPRGGGGG